MIRKGSAGPQTGIGRKTNKKSLTGYVRQKLGPKVGKVSCNRVF